MIDSTFFMLYFAVPLLFFTVLRYTEKKNTTVFFFSFCNNCNFYNAIFGFVAALFWVSGTARQYHLVTCSPFSIYGLAYIIVKLHQLPLAPLFLTNNWFMY